MDLNKLINEIADNSRSDEPKPAPRQEVLAPKQAPPPPEPEHIRFADLAAVTKLNERAGAIVLDRAAPDDVVVTIAADPDEHLRRWLLAPLDQQSRHWVVDNAMQLGTPTGALRADAAKRLVALANALAAEGVISEADLEPQDAPEPDLADGAEQCPTPAKGNPIVGAQPQLHLSPSVSFGVGGGHTSATVISDESAPAPEQAAAADEDIAALRMHLAQIIGLASRHGQEAVAQVAEDAPHPLLQAGLALLGRPIPRNELDQILLDLQQAIEAAERQRCDLIRNAITAIHAGEPAEEFLARN
ncbi:MAG: hypothetical protein PF961_17470 [Planctomycetota bacterium]|jgi:hypothetical protein|nr:hypothetical protein [Planctomycetota bacterium]